MNCSNCGCTMHDAIYVCRENGFQIEDSINDFVFVIETHDFLNDDEEINSVKNIKYCQICFHMGVGINGCD